VAPQPPRERARRTDAGRQPELSLAPEPDEAAGRPADAEPTPPSDAEPTPPSDAEPTPPSDAEPTPPSEAAPRAGANRRTKAARQPAQEPSGSDAQEQPAEDLAAPVAAGDEEGARLIALNMALNGSSRDETERYLADHFKLSDPEALLDDVYTRADR
jgi:hypothetical protein